jgi:esterase/lipase
LTPEKLGAATFNDWIQDSIEAYQIGLTLGEQVVITCASTGCSLAMYLAYFFPDKIHALIMVSPNFSPADSRSFLALGPLGLITTRLLLGKYQEFKPSNNLQAYYWTYKYETSVIPEMINLVAGIKNLDLSRIQTPVLTIYTPFDKVVSTQEIEKNTQRLGSIRNKLVPIFETKEHILAGDIMNPKLNNKIIQLSIQFLKNL